VHEKGVKIMGLTKAFDEAIGYLLLYIIFFESILIILASVYSTFIPNLSILDIVTASIISVHILLVPSDMVKFAGLISMLIISIINVLINEKIKDATYAIIAFYIIIALSVVLPFFINKVFIQKMSLSEAFKVTLKDFIRCYITSWLFSIAYFILINIIIFYIVKSMKGKRGEQ